MATEVAEVKMTALEELIEQERQRFRVPGVAVAVVKGDEVLVSRGFGKRDVAKDQPVTDQTLFAIGSSTKAFTASLVGALVDDGLIEWDKPVRNYLPHFRMYDPVATEHLTARDMLSHRSGLPRHDFLWYDNQTLKRAEIVERLQYLEPNKSFRELWQYNNLMFITAGYLAGELLGCTWEEAVKQRLLDPLGMTNTNFSVYESQKSADHSRPYGEKADEIIEVPFLGAELAGPAGSINSCIADMTRWAMVQVEGKVEGRQVISPAALKELHAATMVLPESALDDLWPEAKNNAYALGWFVMNYRGRTVVHHGGNVDGFSTMVSLLPDEKIGVVVLTNLHPSGLRDVVPYVVYDHLLGLEPLPWGERYDELYRSLLGGMKAAAAHKAEKAASAPPSHPLEAYAGRYNHPGYGDFTITLDDGHLTPHYNDLTLEMNHIHYDVWGLVLPIPEAPPFDMWFEVEPDGSIGALRLPMEPSVEPIRFKRQAEAGLSDPDVLRRYTGAYVMGPLKLRVELERDEHLVADVLGQGRVQLLPKDERVFTAKEQPGLSFEFVLGTGGRVEKVVVQPAGIFTPDPEAG